MQLTVEQIMRLGISKSDLSVKPLSDSSIMNVAFNFLPKIRPEYWCDIQKAQDDGYQWGDLLQFLPGESSVHLR